MNKMGGGCDSGDGQLMLLGWIGISKTLGLFGFLLNVKFGAG